MLSVDQDISIFFPHCGHHVIIKILHGKCNGVIEGELAWSHSLITCLATKSHFSSVDLCA